MESECPQPQNKTNAPSQYTMAITYSCVVHSKPQQKSNKRTCLLTRPVRPRPVGPRVR